MSRRPTPRRAALAALALAAALAVAAGAGARTHRHALVVGQNRGGPTSGPLYFAEQDAGKVADVLTELGGFPASQVHVVRDVDRPTLLRELERAVRRVAGTPREAGDQVLLLFYYSGHGTETGMELGRSEVAYEELERYLELSGADVTLTMIDACHAGAMTRAKGRDKGAAKAPSFLVELDPTGTTEGRVVISSSAADELSQESDEIGGSYFTHFLVSGLRGAGDGDADGRVTLQELYAYLYRETTYRTAGTRSGVQHPTYDLDLTGTGDLVLADTQPEGGTLVIAGDRPGRYVVFDEQRRAFVAEVQVVAGQERRLALAPGRYRVQLRGEDALHEEVLWVEAGEATALDHDALAEVAYADDPTKGAMAEWKRRAHGPRLEIGARVGMQGFLDETTRSELFPPVALFGIQLAVDRVGRVPGLRIFVDAAGGGRQMTLDFGYELVPVRFSEVSFGGGVTYGLSHKVMRLYGGVRLGGLYLMRSFSLWSLQPPQDLVTFIPGVVGGVGARFGGPVGIVAEGRLNYLYYAVSGENRSIGNAELFVVIDATF